MSLLLDAYLTFVTFVFLCLLAMDINGTLRKPDDTQTRSKTYRPRVLVMVPCKGEEKRLRQNLESLKAQAYGRYSVVAIVDAKTDGAVAAIRQSGVSMMVASGPRGAGSGKVRALLHAMKRLRGFEVYVVADSDVNFSREWLGRLIAPLSNKRVGISTSYPFFEPKAGFWSRVKMVWGFVGNSLMESSLTRFGWGGSLAFRKALMDRRAMERMSRSVSDDISVTNTCKMKGLKIAYVPEARMRIACDDTLLVFAEWANRQTSLSVLGNRRVLYYGITYYSAEILVLLTGIIGTLLLSPIFLVLLLHAARSVWKTFARAGEARADTALIALLIPFIYLVNLAAATGTRSITWRGARYRLR
ncbi:MAG: glycosyltransferase family 2 protein [Candidatus Marsarchaeota archaeon]|nr:glycosyltransferase family 2 protein [Candidatus Marsarchaeota archaeon]